MKRLAVLFFALALTASAQVPAKLPAQAKLLETMTWDEAEKILTPATIVVIPLGAGLKEHGRHLQLNNDFLMAEYFKRRVLEAGPKNVAIAPTINYSFYPAF